MASSGGAQVSTADRNRRKRERKKQQQLERRKQEEAATVAAAAAVLIEKEDDDDIEIEYVAEPIAADLPDDFARIFVQERIAIANSANESVSDSSQHQQTNNNQQEFQVVVSKRKLRERLRPTVADLKRHARRPDLVEAHDITAADPHFLLALKAAPGTVSVPRHWGRKRKYLQGKRGFEKPPFALPDFILKTGIAQVRQTVADEESNQSAKQKNRARVAPKMGAMDVDYKTLHDAFFKHQTKPKNLTKFGDLYYEGKELEVNNGRANVQNPGGPLSQQLKDALGMTELSPPPWLINMQRYGPPPSYPGLKIPGLNAPLPNANCQYGYHPTGWGKPPVDAYGRPLYGGNPFDPSGKSGAEDDAYQNGALVTSDGKTISTLQWGALPMDAEHEESDEDDDNDDESNGSGMEESENEDETVTPDDDGIESVLAPPLTASVPTAPVDMRKQAGDETPHGQVKQLYQLVEQTKLVGDQSGAVFASEVAYIVPTTAATAMVPEGAESVLSKAVPNDANKKREKKPEDENELEKNYKF
jgi:splicing factor 3B subunit 2